MNIIPPTKPTALAPQRQNTAADVLRAYFARRSKATVIGYTQDLQHLRLWLIGEGETSFLSDNQQLAAWLFAQSPGYLNGLLMRWVNWQAQNGLAPHTVNRRLSAVRSLVRLGRMLGVITWALDVQGVRAPENVRDMRGPDMAGVRGLFAAAKREGDEKERALCTALLHLTFERGLRVIELQELKLEHLQLDAHPPHVLVRGKGRTGLTSLTVTPATMDALLAWLSVRGAPVPGAIFTLKKNGAPMSRPSIASRLRKLGLRSGVKNVRPHGMRHAAITAALDELNGDIRTVMKFSRHAKPETVMRYDDSRRDAGGDVARTLDKALKRGGGK